MFFKFYKQIGDFSNKTIRNLAKDLNVLKIGHTGILDPLAEGLIIFATDDDTKLFEYLKNTKKTYIATARLFLQSDTLDVTGNVEELKKKNITRLELINAINQISKTKSQVPPIYSAKKINGKKAYEYARENKIIEIRQQSINIDYIELIDFIGDTFKIRTTVSSGTYIRTLLLDIAKLLGTRCVMTSLKRIAIGEVELDSLKPGEYSKIKMESLFDIPKYYANQAELKELSFGRKILVNLSYETLFIINSSTNEIASAGEIQNNYFYPKKVFNRRLIWKN
ncbi:tRNA pseudouridine(55) synthase TruB [Mycoplasmopsis cynos]|uniref:tRNA pseudouridine(55) synthase TruB n=1 Tax=Mycoplasmopsis cynos TaxID=171284 RepID=UPI0024CA1C58|nr:tRNA pseudouridine(55) synthase TruB [Mycoplasmopsis cynos]MCU9934972.1 tRNA pseudouridine(55) synthase TruB [Mycoplasmopsis cynos]WAM08429.1 tRNA pseudouridine(55) synthase TruB [Mycoplasmopsis cynos]